MMSIPFVAIMPSLIVAALTPAKVTDVKTDSSATPAAKPPAVIYVKAFSISESQAKAKNSEEQGRPRLLGTLRGGQENTVIAKHREAEQEHTLANVPVILQKALIEDLSKSVAPANNGDGAHVPPGSWIILPVNSSMWTPAIALWRRALVSAQDRVTWRCGQKYMPLRI
jgi:hypothetical protein